MGYILNAKCTNCDFENEFMFGGTRSNYSKVHMVPALDANNKFQNVNYLIEKDKKNYLFYYHQALKGYKMKFYMRRGYDWGGLQLNPIRNYCPNCRKYFLNFILVALVD